MRVFARWATGVVAGSTPRVEVCFHAPPRLTGVTLRIWELAAYPGRDGETRRDGASEIEIAAIHGDLVHGLRSERRLRVTGVDRPSAPTQALRLALGLAEETVELAVPHEADELAARPHQLMLSVHQGGTELFRSPAPCLVTPAAIWPRASVSLGYPDDRGAVVGAGAEVPLRHHHACFGRGDGRTLHVLGDGYFDGEGRLLDRPGGAPLLVRAGKPFLVFVHREPHEIALGQSRLLVDLCTALGSDGSIRLERFDVADPVAIDCLERRADGGLLPGLAAKTVVGMEHALGALAEVASKLRSWT
jgi:hypothetical protein